MAADRRTRPRTRWIIAGAAAAALLVAGGVIAGVVSSGGGSTDAARLLPDDTEMGEVVLNVRDLDLVRDYYRDAVGLEVLEEDEGEVVLGDGDPLIVLTAGAEGVDDPREAGLYHSAIRYADRPSLARALMSVAQTAPETYQGASDHAVSLAFYFVDPEGNGVELYVDRPREEWVWEDGRVRMGSTAVDANAFIAEYLPQDAAGASAMGHVHLRVGDLDAARDFYSGTLGFDVTAEADGAVFYSAGGYHHHLATNTWQSAGAGPRADAVGLERVTVILPARADVDELAARLDAAGAAYERSDDALELADPWGNGVRIVVG